MVLSLLTLLAAPSSAAEPGSVRSHTFEVPVQMVPAAPVSLVDRVDRRRERTSAIEQQWERALGALRAQPSDEQAARRVGRFEKKLVNQRARLIRAERELHAVGSPARWVDVYFATSREDWERGAGRWYSARDSGRLRYGIATVRIPEEHRAGVVERALQVINVQALDVDAWEAALRAATERAELLTYIHGFNNSFEYATRRTAQIVHDLDVQGGATVAPLGYQGPDQAGSSGLPVVPVLFSWAASGGTPFSGARYVVDENVAARSSLLLARFLDQLVDVRPEARLSVLAHSLGSRLLSDALLDIERSGGLRRSIDQVVFAAPDIDAWLFANRYLDVVVDASDRFTIYCARDDRPIRLSRGVHGGYDRLGGCRDNAVAGLQREGVDVVDASNLYVDLLDHNKVTSSPRLLRDLGFVLAGLDARDPARALMVRGDRAVLPP